MNTVCQDTVVVKKRNLKNNYFSFTLSQFKKAKSCKPGQFVHVKIPDSDIFLRRAFSIASVDKKKNELEIIFKVVGRGTKLMGGLNKGDILSTLGPLGSPFKFPKKNEKVIMVAGGVGFPPLMYLAVEMIEKGHNPKNIVYFYGGRSKEDILERARLKKTGINLIQVTEDGSIGSKGLVTKVLKNYLNKLESLKNLRLYSCGPEGMLKAVDGIGLEYDIPGQISLEAPMPCGVGICLGCVVPLKKGGHARVCCEGPVFDIGEVSL